MSDSGIGTFAARPHSIRAVRWDGKHETLDQIAELLGCTVKETIGGGSWLFLGTAGPPLWFFGLVSKDKTLTLVRDDESTASCLVGSWVIGEEHSHAQFCDSEEFDAKHEKQTRPQRFVQRLLKRTKRASKCD